jgi:hypothetical protein
MANKSNHKRWRVIGGPVLLLVVRSQVANSKAAMHDGKLIDADDWASGPRILSAGFGFDGIIGSESDDQQTTIDAGGAWESILKCARDGGPTDADRSS